MFGLEPRLEAILEIVLLLVLAAFIGWVLGRLILTGRLKTLRAAVADKADELETCRWGKGPGLVKQAAPAVVTPAPNPEVEKTVAEEPPAFVPADPLLPALIHDDTPEPIPAEPAPAAALPVEPDEPASRSAGVLTDALAPINSEAAVLNRIAARAHEVNFDRIGRATAAEADDLKDIVGIGPFLERKLHSLGIYTFRQVANFTKEDITKVNELIEFFPGRIERDDWVAQAKGFYKQKASQKA